MPEIEFAKDSNSKSSFSFTSWNAVPESYHEGVLEGDSGSRTEIHVLYEHSEKEFLKSMAQSGWYVFKIVRVTKYWIDFFFSRHPRTPSVQFLPESIIDQHYTFKPIPSPTLNRGAWG